MTPVGRAIRLWALDGPTLTHDRGLLVVGEKGLITFPVPVFLIEHERGLVLFDTGLVPEAAANPRKVYGAMADDCQIAFTPEQRVDHQLEKLGFHPADITHVLMSHTHWDHTGGIYLFPHAQFYVGDGELQYAFWPLPAAPLFRREDLDPSRGFAWNYIRGDLDLFGDGAWFRICPFWVTQVAWKPPACEGRVSVRRVSGAGGGQPSPGQARWG